ncbi:hypothetical protein [Amycolatopsis taiwanensis]|uniref:Uncharacterized protein n=1 Tax=Amycolatopsis taiwanensis TaxID=342230 RepID=A0A9W6VGW0_9PSEU|nr:hypothetical protein [Amycolatopsis taiwanensis]GLY68150.1 hypothetical protein Atai01_47690 [Amycolatopsis taiwanensis]
MTDPDRSTENPGAHRERQPTTGAGRLRPLLWLVLIVGVSGELVVSPTSLDVRIGFGFGVLIVLSGIGLIVHHYHHRRG